MALSPDETAVGVAGSVTSVHIPQNFCGVCYYAYQTVSGNAVRWEGSWLGFNHWSIMITRI